MSSIDVISIDSCIDTSTTTASEPIPHPNAVTNGHIPNDGTIAIMIGSRSLVTQRSHARLMRLLAVSVNSYFAHNAVVSRSNSGADLVCERWADSAGLPIARFSPP
jgi:hypothetical protein